MQAGKMRHRIEIQKPSGPASPDGQPSERFAFFKTIWAEVRGVSGGEFLRGVQVQAGITDVVSIRFRTDITPQMRLIHFGRTLNIEGVLDPTGKRIELQLHCKELV